MTEPETVQTYEVKHKRVAVRANPNAEAKVLVVLLEGERITGTPCEVDGLPWLKLSLESLRSHPESVSLGNVTAAWVLIDATKTQLGLGRLLVRAPAELGWCAPDKAKKFAIWEVIAKRGIVATKGKDVSSRRLAERLPMGALIRVLEQDSERLHFENLADAGPEEGWVTIKCNGQDVVVNTNDEYMSKQGKQDEVATTVKAEEELEQGPEKIVEALQLYSQRFDLAREPEQQAGQHFFNSQSFPWKVDEEKESTSAATAKAEEELRAELEQELETRSAAELSDKVEDSDGEEIRLCRMCRLPVGERGYHSRDPKGLVHGECCAQLVLLEQKKEEENRTEKAIKKRSMRHAEYSIGWMVEQIPRNTGLLAGRPVPQGMVCLVFDGNSKRLRAAPTIDPAAAVNLEYLSVALQVRLQ
eukprot:CAMPEP_0180834636 /NCGR_PEP_ID=MMETSP1038_2-20121128/77961_1 /TAXON_ID=632150 /ORGANISM="Azadinium spinosum, Strain 3D9" /LENGTH=415 /DNA_ID=CAMNT_0022877881 /DNA_START=35 /DNA_END=1279 /DNA_ORIENTATION=+